MPSSLADYFHACTECEWTGWTLPEINADGEHLDPAGGTCGGELVASPPPTQITERTDRG